MKNLLGEYHILNDYYDYSCLVKGLHVRPTLQNEQLYQGVTKK